MKIAIIGAGNMGGSIARGLAKGSLIDDSDIIVSNPSAGKKQTDTHLRSCRHQF